MNFIEFINQFKQKLSGWDPSLNDANIPRNAIGWKLKMIEKKTVYFHMPGRRWSIDLKNRLLMSS